MDEIDFVILKKLIENCRVTYRELADMIDMSVSSIHKRIDKLINDEIIEGFSARPSVFALKYLFILIFGISKAKSLDLVSKELGQNENVFSVGIASGKMLYIAGHLRDITGLRDFSTYVSKIASMSEPTIGIMYTPYITTPEPLTTIDYKILKSLNRDARKPITDVADDVGISARTVKKRMDRMIDNHLVDFTIEMSEKAQDNLTTVFHLHLKEDTNIDSTIQHLYTKYHQNIIFCLSYSNIPNFLTMHTWTKNTHESHSLQEELQTEGFRDVIPHLVIYTKYYDTWVDQLLRTK